MPLLLEKDGYQFYFKKGEPLIPYKKPHVHVRGHGGSIQFYLIGKIEIKKDNKSLGSNKITEIRTILKENKDNFLTITMCELNFRFRPQLNFYSLTHIQNNV